MDIPSHVRKTFYTKIDIDSYIVKHQLHGKLYDRKIYMKYEQDVFNDYQNLLYTRTINGLNAYSKQEVSKMPADLIKAINKRHNHTQRTLNIWKQQITNEITNKLFDSIWTGKNRIIKHGIGTKARLIDTTRNFVDSNKKNRLSFKDLGITKKDIVDKLIKEKILPKNFYELKPKT